MVRIMMQLYQSDSYMLISLMCNKGLGNGVQKKESLPLPPKIKFADLD